MRRHLLTSNRHVNVRDLSLEYQTISIDASSSFFLSSSTTLYATPWWTISYDMAKDIPAPRQDHHNNGHALQKVSRDRVEKPEVARDEADKAYKRFTEAPQDTLRVSTAIVMPYVADAFNSLTMR